jgi:regulator of replication initiation timing
MTIDKTKNTEKPRAVGVQVEPIVMFDETVTYDRLCEFGLKVTILHAGFHICSGCFGKKLANESVDSLIRI